jgi:hypothetical protein
MKLAVLFVMIGGLAGCATSNKTFGPNGKEAHSISCNGAANSMGTCLEKAGEICGRSGYDVLVQNGSVTPFGMANGYANSSGASASGFGGAMVSRNILVQCKAAS